MPRLPFSWCTRLNIGNRQMKTMAKETPSRNAGLVTFNAEITLIGDGSDASRVVAGDRLSDDEALREVGRAYPLSSFHSSEKSPEPRVDSDHRFHKLLLVVA
ncbi:MAG: hypothetical protein AAF152_06450 [Cyanobacteria bacterium P01_A01_bin.114]